MIAVVEWTNFDDNPYVKNFQDIESATDYIRNEFADFRIGVHDELAYSELHEDFAKATMVNDDMYFWRAMEVLQ